MGHVLIQWFTRLSIFVNQYKDQQGINYAFISDMSLDVADVTIHVTGMTPYSKEECENLGIWLFG